MIALAFISLLAATVNGALGYGFSSITVPLALLIVSSRVLNPSLVLLEVALNAYVLWINRRSVPKVWRRVLFVMIGLVPGIVVGTSVLTRVDPVRLKLVTFVVLLPLILLQAAGFRRAIRAERTTGVIFGAGVGALYAITTISGPPLAMLLTNQGLAKQDFRASLAVIRFAEASLAATLYLQTGLFTGPSFSLLLVIIPGVVLGVPLGAWISRRVHDESFRRLCMGFDAAIVAFGLSTLIRTLHLADGGAAYAPLIAVLVFDAAVLYRFARSPLPSASP